MAMKITEDVAQRIVWMRLAQLLINEEYRTGAFKVPIHLALGHETIATSLDAVMKHNDRLLLTHRNIAYNLAREKTLRPIREEYLLRETGLAGGKLGSMNLSNPPKGILYASSILGNNFAVGAGIALALKQKKKGVAFVLGGDGSIEEGTFYESLVFAKSQDLPLAILIENNEWSMSTHIDERRKPIDLGAFAKSTGVEYMHLNGNDPAQYIAMLSEARDIARKSPVLLEVAVRTLGDWVKKEEAGPRFINYHAGPASEVRFNGLDAIVTQSNDDPLFVVQTKMGKQWLSSVVARQLTQLQKDIV
jgi:TPP-dependent pyruvate/acetoin dehydrogenase alpha subunit